MSGNRGKLLLVFNPRAAHGRGGKVLPRIRDRLGAAGFAVEVAETQAPGHARSIVRNTKLGPGDVLAVAGGDGTLFEVVNGLMARDAAKRPTLGLVPLGTGNAFSRDIGLGPGRWREGLELIARGQARRVDVARFNCGDDEFYFLNIAGLGFVVDAGRTAARLKFLGRVAYTLATLWRCLRLRSVALRMWVDGREVRRECLFMVMSNSRYTGTTFLIAPEAKIDDGKLDIVMVRTLPRLRLLRLFPTIYSGRHVDHDEVEVLRGRDIRIDAPAGAPFMVDGEFRGIAPAAIECLAGAIEMFSGPVERP